MSNRTLSIDDAIYSYMLSHSLREPDILLQLREETAQHDMARMQIAPEQGQLLSLLIKLLGAQQTIEIGVYTGYSALCVALALPDNGRVIACDINDDWTQIAQRYWHQAGVQNKIELLIAPASKTLERLLKRGNANSFDFAFIDADKPNYINYYETCLKLLRPGGIIAVDNTLWGGDVANSEVNDDDTVAIRQFNDHLYKDERVDISLIPIGDGLTLARKR